MAASFLEHGGATSSVALRALRRLTESSSAVNSHSLALVLLLGSLSVTAAVVLGERCAHRFWWMTEAGVAILVGMAVGLVWFASSQNFSADVRADAQELQMFEFQPAVFTLLLLPPIIFESGFNLNHRFFFSNIGAILNFAFLGTLVVFAVIAPSLYYGLGGDAGLLTPMEACAFAALIVAVDPVATLAIFSSTGADPKLNALIFGESVLNDAVAIVLFKTVVQLGATVESTPTGVGAVSGAQLLGAVGAFCLIFVGSVLIGVLGGAAIALLFKLANLRGLHGGGGQRQRQRQRQRRGARGAHRPHRPSYATFLAAEWARLSGIVAALFAGAACTTYVRRNMSAAGAALSTTTVQWLAKFSETSVFVLIGYGFWLYTIGGGAEDVAVGPLAFPNRTFCVETSASHATKMDGAFVLLTLALCLLARAASVFPMAALANIFRTEARRIRLNEQAVIWFSGHRGAIALALAVEFPTAADVAGTAGEANFCYQRDHVVSCTIIVVLCTVFLMGGFTKPVLNLCGIPMGVEALKGERAAKQPMTSRRWWKRAVLRVERELVRPVLIAGYRPTPTPGGGEGEGEGDPTAGAPQRDVRGSRQEQDGGAIELVERA